MLRLTVATALLVVLTAGCGSDSGGSSGSDAEAGTGEQPEASATSKATYFQRADSDGINKAAATAQEALATAYAEKTQKRCDAQGSKGYPAWRMCWHQALDPVEQSLGDLSQEMERLAGKDFPQACVAKLTTAAAAFEEMRSKVGALLTGIDSDERASQKRAMRTYGRDLLDVGNGFAPVFQALTKVCYSPEDLASINASPSPSG